MSYKIGLILSTLFVALFFLFGADLITIQSLYSGLDSKANNISYLISRNGVVDDDFIHFIETSFNVNFICDKVLAPSFGEQITYQITTKYQPLVISSKEMTIVIQRMTIVGFYG